MNILKKEGGERANGTKDYPIDCRRAVHAGLWHMAVAAQQAGAVAGKISHL